MRLAPYPERSRPTFNELFRTMKPLIGVVHLRPLPGSPGYDGLFLDVLDAALADARAIEGGGAAGLIVENFGDMPYYPDNVPPETIAAMTRLVTEIRKVVRIPVGVNMLRNDARGGVAVAAATGAGFVRVNVHTGAMVTDQGLVMGRAFESLRLREVLRSRTLIFADLRVKHAEPLVEFDLQLEAADIVHRGRADAVLVTGPATGQPTDLDLVSSVKACLPNIPVLVGSGVDLDTLQAVLRAADGCIVGTALKRDGRIEEPVDIERVRAMAEIAEALAPRMMMERRPRFEDLPPRREERRPFEERPDRFAPREPAGRFREEAPREPAERFREEAPREPAGRFREEAPREPAGRFREDAPREPAGRFREDAPREPAERFREEAPGEEFLPAEAGFATEPAPEEPVEAARPPARPAGPAPEVGEALPAEALLSGEIQFGRGPKKGRRR